MKARILVQQDPNFFMRLPCSLTGSVNSGMWDLIKIANDSKHFALWIIGNFYTKCESVSFTYSTIAEHQPQGCTDTQYRILGSHP
jgi:hypothetical protein